MGIVYRALDVTEIQRIVNKCLAKDPGDRYQSDRDLFLDVREVKRDSESHPSSAVAASWIRGRRFPARMYENIVTIGYSRASTPPVRLL